MNRREFIGGVAAGVAFGDDILKSETERLVQFRENLGGPVSGELLTDDWPEGKGDDAYDFYSPLLFNKDWGPK